jgi:hypothetical protein
MRDSTPNEVTATMSPPALQLAPSRSGARTSSIGEPPSSAIFFTAPSAQKPTHSPSGAKNGARAPSASRNA